jgi:hypothetical protein
MFFKKYTKIFLSTYWLPIYKLGVLHYNIFNEFYITWPTLVTQLFLHTYKPYFNYFIKFSTYIWRCCTEPGHTHRPELYQSNDFCIILYKFCILLSPIVSFTNLVRMYRLSSCLGHQSGTYVLTSITSNDVRKKLVLLEIWCVTKHRVTWQTYLFIALNLCLSFFVLFIKWGSF